MRQTRRRANGEGTSSQSSSMIEDEEENMETERLNESLAFGNDQRLEPSQAVSDHLERSRQRLAELDEESAEKMINYCVQFLLTRDKTVVKVSDISREVTQSHQLTAAVLERATKKLEKIFGLTIKFFNPASHTEFIVVNALPFSDLSTEDEENNDDDTLRLTDLRSDEEHLRTGILLPILAVIWMNGGHVSEDIIGRLLTKLDLDWDNKQEEVQGVYDCAARTKKVKLRDLVTKIWKQQKYLNIERIEGSGDQPQFEYSWGPRAEEEVNKMAMLKFVSQIVGDGTSPETWTHQFRQAQEQIGSQDSS